MSGYLVPEELVPLLLAPPDERRILVLREGKLMPRDAEARAPAWAVGDKAKLGPEVVEVVAIFGDGEWARVKDARGRESRVQLRLLVKVG